MDTTSRRSDARRDRDALFLRPEPGTRAVLAELAKHRGETMAAVVASLVRDAAGRRRERHPAVARLRAVFDAARQTPASATYAELDAAWCEAFRIVPELAPGKHSDAMG